MSTSDEHAPEEPTKEPVTTIEELKEVLDTMFASFRFRAVRRSARDERELLRHYQGYMGALRDVYEWCGLEMPERIPFDSRFVAPAEPEAELTPVPCPKCGAVDGLEVEYRIEANVTADRHPLYAIKVDEGRWANSPKRYNLYDLDRSVYEDAIDDADVQVEVACTSCGWSDNLGDHQFELA